MNKKVIKYLLIIILGIFLLLYFFGNNIYQGSLTEKKILTEEQIIKFENDVKNGIEIDLNDYVVKEKKFDNAITDINRKISETINYGFKKVFKYLLNNIDI